MQQILNDFQKEVEVSYQDEDYLVRDNGSVFRKCRPEKRKRKLDEVWTFGEENAANPYLHISDVRVHRIVATAFHGEPPDQKYVVDHIDTNCRNNRPENLRWLTRLENALKNPATRKKIEYLCGSIEAFLENPSMLNDLQGDPNYKWMRAVTPDEAKNCLTRMSIWANSEPSGVKSIGSSSYQRNFENRVYKPIQKWEAGLSREPGLEFALTPWCGQYMWRANTYFPSCPYNFGTDPVFDYHQNLTKGAVLAYGEHPELSFKMTVHEARILNERSSILVISEGNDGKWPIVGIEINNKRHFVHFVLGTYLNRDEALHSYSSKNEYTNFWSEGYSNTNY